MPVPAFAYVSLRAKSGPFKAALSPQAQAGPLTIDYTYDPLNRLTAADYSTGDYYHYTYEAVGNRLTSINWGPVNGEAGKIKKRITLTAQCVTA